jgi:hypothetical protein
LFLLLVLVLFFVCRVAGSSLLVCLGFGFWVCLLVPFLYCFFCISSVPRVATVFAAGGKHASKTARESMRRRLNSNCARSVTLTGVRDGELRAREGQICGSSGNGMNEVVAIFANVDFSIFR